MKYGIFIAIAIFYIAATLYFQSLCIGLSMLAFFFGLFWFKEAGRKRPEANGRAPLWWMLCYSIPVIVSFLSSLTLIGFAINVYFGGLVAAFFLGIFVAGSLFAAMEAG